MAVQASPRGKRSLGQQVNSNREKVTGARSVWCTVADATTKSIIAALKKVFTTESKADMNVILKYKPG